MSCGCDACDADRERETEALESSLAMARRDRDQLMHALDDIAKFTPEVYDNVDNQGRPYQSAGLAELIDRARIWVHSSGDKQQPQ